jgi:hypothetical protein
VSALATLGIRTQGWQLQLASPTTNNSTEYLPDMQQAEAAALVGRWLAGYGHLTHRALAAAP